MELMQWPFFCLFYLIRSFFLLLEQIFLTVMCLKMLRNFDEL